MRQLPSLTKAAINLDFTIESDLNLIRRFYKPNFLDEVVASFGLEDPILELKYVIFYVLIIFLISF
jgi:hypothetical protein